MKKNTAWMIGLAAAAVLAFAHVVQPAAAEPVKIRAGWVGTPATLIPVLYSEGYRNPDLIRHYGKSYTVEPIFFRGSSPQITALATGDIDFMQPAFSTLVAAIENAKLEDLRVFMDVVQDGVPGYQSQSYLVAGDSPIKTIEDLRGKTLGTNAIGGALDVAMQAALKEKGLINKRDYNIVEVQLGNQVPFLVEKKVDLIGVGMPFSEEARRRANARELFTMKDGIGVSQQIMMAAREGFLNKNREAVKDFFEDYVRALHWYFDPKNRAAVIEIVSRFNKRKPEEYADWVLTEKDYYRDPYGMPNVEALQRNVDQYRELGFGKRKIDVNKYVDLSFVEDVKKRLGSATPVGWKK